MNDSTRFSFTQTEGAHWVPLLPIRLNLNRLSVDVLALLDTGATVNVLPHRVGAQLGAEWSADKPTLRLTGNLASFEAIPLIVNAEIHTLSAVPLVFAWTQSDDIPVILGNVNFFLEFNACFYRTERYFELRPR